MANWLSIILFAFIGGSSRYLVGQALPAVAGFPWATVGINLIGSGVLAWLSHAQRLTMHWPEAITVGLGIGGVGAFTTFSTFGVEAATLMTQQRWGLASGYILVTLLGGLVCSAVGVWSARRWWSLPVIES